MGVKFQRAQGWEDVSRGKDKLFCWQNIRRDLWRDFHLDFGRGTASLKFKAVMLPTTFEFLSHAQHLSKYFKWNILLLFYLGQKTKQRNTLLHSCKLTELQSGNSRCKFKHSRMRTGLWSEHIASMAWAQVLVNKYFHCLCNLVLGKKNVN